MQNAFSVYNRHWIEPLFNKRCFSRNTIQHLNIISQHTIGHAFTYAPHAFISISLRNTILLSCVRVYNFAAERAMTIQIALITRFIRCGGGCRNLPVGRIVGNFNFDFDNELEIYGGLVLGYFDVRNDFIVIFFFLI